VDAIQCAVEIQKELKVKNPDLPEYRRMEFRIGINLGDFIEEGETIYEDGVNIAAKFESLAKGVRNESSFFLTKNHLFKNSPQKRGHGCGMAVSVSFPDASSLWDG